MKGKIYTLILILFYSSFSFAQSPENALNLSWYHLNGTARNQAIGGAMGSLGGDATANHINPAGLAFFKTSDILITPGFEFNKAKSNFRGTDNKGDKENSFILGTSGFVIGGLGMKAKNTFAVTVTKQADFNQKIYYGGQNDYSSFAEPLADEFASSHLTIDQALNSSDISLKTKMSLYTYLVDTVTINGSPQVIARSENPALRDQQNRIESSGGITEVAFGFGSELSKKFMLGFSLGVQSIKREQRTYYHESDATGDIDNDFSFLTYDETYSVKGVGINLKGGIIYRPKEYFRLGFAFHTPNLTTLTETSNAGLAAHLENLFGANNGYDSVASSVFTGSEKSETKYMFNTPAKLMISGSYVFREEANVERQKGFLTADIEYTNYTWMKYNTYDESIPQDYYKAYNEAIDAVYKGAFNFRVGGELKFKTIMGRAGFAYYGSPYKDSELKGRKMYVSGGLGYRNKGIFIDLTYVQLLNKDINLPYRVNSPRANTFANLKENGGNVLLTFGIKI